MASHIVIVCTVPTEKAVDVIPARGNVSHGRPALFDDLPESVLIDRIPGEANAEPDDCYRVLHL